MRSSIFAFICVMGTPAFGGSLQFVSPNCGRVVSGNISLNASTSAVGVASIEFSIGSHRIGTSSGSKMSILWNSAEAMDGNSAIQASAKDLLGNEIDSGECLVQIGNRNASLAVNSPDLSAALSGNVQLSVTGSDATAFPAVWTLNIDGEEQSVVWTDNAWRNPNSVNFTLDTTRFTNGKHELHISMNSRTGPSSPQWVNWRAMVNRVIQIQNGRAWMDVVPQYQSIYLVAGGQQMVGCQRLYTDGSAGACGTALYASDDASVASVDVSGKVTARQSGFTRITVSDGSKSSYARVWVSTDTQVPHFLGNGTMQRGYDSAKSLFVIAPFFLDPDALRHDSSLRDDVTLAGINTLGHGVYLNPRDANASFSSWQSSFDNSIAPKMQWAKDNGFHLLLTGDDLFRRIGGDAWYTLNWPSGKQAVQYAMGKFANTGVGIAIEGIDEASMLWGPRPSPLGKVGQASYLFDRIDCLGGTCTVHWPGSLLQNGMSFALKGASQAALNTPARSSYTVVNRDANGFQFQAAAPVTGSFDSGSSPDLEYLWFGGNYCANGAACSPVVPNNALSSMRDWMRTSGVSAPVSFPALAADSAEVQGNWIGKNSLSDYASHYFTSLKTRTTYPWTEGIQEMVSSMESALVSRQPYLRLDRPQLMLISLAGASYTKGGSSSPTYLPGTDSLDNPGVSAQHVSGVMMNAAALGAAGLRLYYFEAAGNAANRAAAPPGTALQTGANSSNLQADSWQAMGYAANLLTKVLQPYLLGAALNAPSYGRNITAAAREGSAGRMLLVVNGNDWQRTIRVDFGPYRYGTAIARYRLQVTGIATDLLADSTGETITLGPGESVVYLFAKTSANLSLKRTVVSRAAAAANVAGIRYGYIYRSALEKAAAVSCTVVCTVDYDPKLGEIAYKLLYRR